MQVTPADDSSGDTKVRVNCPGPANGYETEPYAKEDEPGMRDDLVHMAGKFACIGCRWAGMSPTQQMNAQAEEVDASARLRAAEAALAEKTARLIIAQRTLEAAQQGAANEVNDANRQILGVDAPIVGPHTPNPPISGN